MTEALAFTGLRNQGNPLSLSPGCLQQAEDVVVTQYGMLEGRWGYGAGMGFTGCTDLWSPEHLRYGFVVAGGVLYQGNEGLAPATSASVASGLVDGTYHWASTPTGDNTFFAGDTEAGWVRNGIIWPLRFPDPARPEVAAIAGGMPAGKYQVTQIYRHAASGMYGPCAPSEQISLPANSAMAITSRPPAGYAADIYVTAADSTVERYLTSVAVAGLTVVYDTGQDGLQWPTPAPNVNAWPFPAGPVAGLGWRDGFLFAGAYSPQSNTTRIYVSREWQYQLWERDAWTEDQAGAKVTGRCHQMLGLEEGLLIVTDTMVGLLSPDRKTLARLANYGAPPGRPVAKDQDGVAIHTVRGIRTFPPWDDKARHKHVPNPGTYAYTFVGERHGIRYAQVQTDVGGSPFNQY